MDIAWFCFTLSANLKSALKGIEEGELPDVWKWI